MINLREQLKNMGQAADSQTRERIKASLMYQIGNYKKAENSGEQATSAAFGWRAAKLAWRPVGVFAMVALLLLGSSGWLMVAAESSSAGDSLFVVKRALEKTKEYMTNDSVNRIELASIALDKRVNELQRVFYQESKLVAAGEENSKPEKVSLAVAEVKKQLADVNSKFIHLQSEDRNDRKKTAVAALTLNNEINFYQRELKEIKNKADDIAVNGELDSALEQAEDINSNILAVIVDNHQKGDLKLSHSEMESKLNQHVAEIEKKVAIVEEAIVASQEKSGDELKLRAKEAKQKIAEAKKAIQKNEYELVLTLANDSNAILKMLYGSVNEIISVEKSDSANSSGEIKGAASTSGEFANDEVEADQAVSDSGEQVKNSEVKQVDSGDGGDSGQIGNQTAVPADGEEEKEEFEVRIQ